MKKILFIVLTLLMLCGCEKRAVTDYEPENVVKAYIMAASSVNWNIAMPLLSGEALQELQQNSSNVKSTENVLSIETSIVAREKDIARVYAEVAKSTDLASYEFRLQKIDGQWLIYKVSQSDIKQPELKMGVLPAAAVERLKKYLELPAKEKREKCYLYLAGPALLSAQKYKDSIPEEQPVVNILDIVSEGVSDKYVIASATYKTEMTGYKPVILTAIVDMVNISGDWRIIRLDIAKVAGEE